MDPRFSRSRLIAAALISALAGGPMLTPTAHAQTIGAAGDPPARVGRLARSTGVVSFHAQGADHWDPATLNYPITSGDAFWTQPDAQAAIEVSGTRIVLNGQTELDIDTLDDRNLAATEPQGEAYIRVRHLAAGETIAITTPRGVATLRAPGRYAVVAGDTEHPTSVTVLEGAAEFAGQNLSLQVGAGQTGVISGTDALQTQVQPAQPDAFVTAQLDRERPPPRQAAAPPAVIAAMSGGDDLDAYGTWQTAPQYGTVWYPQVEPGWVPYRHGHWAYVAPWGWTWVDDAPWGFAPFHYGRWASIDGRWAWVPSAYTVAADPAPVYAPALVSFVDVGGGLAAGAALGAAAGLAVGWLPLGPSEPYRPWYHASPAYVRSLNTRYVQNVTNISNVTTINNVTVNRYVNAAATSVAPASAMATSAPMAGVARPVPAADLARARPVIGRVPVAPTTATLGVTPALATRLQVRPPPAGVSVPGRPVAPGPAIAATTIPGRPGSLAPLRNAALPATAASPGIAAPPPHDASHSGAPGPAIVTRPPGAEPRPSPHPGEAPPLAVAHPPPPVVGSHAAAPVARQTAERPPGPVVHPAMEPRPTPPPAPRSEASVRPPAPSPLPHGPEMPLLAHPAPPPPPHPVAVPEPVHASQPPPQHEAVARPPIAVVRPPEPVHVPSPPPPASHPPPVAAPPPRPAAPPPAAPPAVHAAVAPPAPHSAPPAANHRGDRREDQR